MIYNLLDETEKHIITNHPLCCIHIVPRHASFGVTHTHRYPRGSIEGIEKIKVCVCKSLEDVKKLGLSGLKYAVADLSSEKNYRTPVMQHYTCQEFKKLSRDRSGWWRRCMGLFIVRFNGRWGNLMFLFSLKGNSTKKCPWMFYVHEIFCAFLHMTFSHVVFMANCIFEKVYFVCVSFGTLGPARLFSKLFFF